MAWTAIRFAAIQVCVDAFEVRVGQGQETSQALEVSRLRLPGRSLFLVTSFSLDRSGIFC
jgi:hypothetical protein